MESNKSKVVTRMLVKRILKLASDLNHEYQVVQGRSFIIPFNRRTPTVQNQFINMAGFIIQHHLNYKLYLRVMREFSVNFYPTNLYGRGALEKYTDYITKLKRRYGEIKNFNPKHRSFNIIRNDLYAVVFVSPHVSAQQFYEDGSQTFHGYHDLKANFETIAELVHPASLTILEDLIECRKVSRSRYKSQVEAAIYD